MQCKYLLAGGSGYLGQALGRLLRERGHEVVVLTRSRPRRRGDGIREVQWDPASPEGDWKAELEGATAVINLAGSSINAPPTTENRRQILQTRIDSVRALGGAFAACRQPPATWVQASAVGYYGDAGDKRCDEKAPAGTTVLAGICRQWEEEFASWCPTAVRGVVLRIGVVLGRKGGAYPQLARAVRRFAGGTAGCGRQGMSWIHQTDMELIFLQALDDATMRGAYNASAPEPVPNAEFMRLMREVLRRPWSPPVPAFVLRPILRWVVRTDPALVLEGQLVLPARLEEAGYRFRFPRLALALADLVDRRR